MLLIWVAVAQVTRCSIRLVCLKRIGLCPLRPSLLPVGPWGYIGLMNNNNEPRSQLASISCECELLLGVLALRALLPSWFKIDLIDFVDRR
jgi:hypothetical protein